MVTSSAWDWYQSSIAQHLDTHYSLSPSRTGLILVSAGIAYIITSPVVGYFLSQGMMKPTLWIHILGMVIITLGYILLGPIPQLKNIASIGLTVSALIFHGIGFSLSYIGKRFVSFLFSLLLSI